MARLNSVKPTDADLMAALVAFDAARASKGDATSPAAGSPAAGSPDADSSSGCPPPLSWVRRSLDRLGDFTLDTHLHECVDCALEVERLDALERALGPPPTAHRRPIPSLGARLRSMVELSAPPGVAVLARTASRPEDHREFERGMLAYRQGRHAAAVNHLRRARGSSDRSAAIEFYLGMSCLLVPAGRPGTSPPADEAIEALTCACRLRPRRTQYRFYLAQALLLAERGDDAANALEVAGRGSGPFAARAKAQLQRLRRLR